MRQGPGAFTQQQGQCDWSKSNVGAQRKGRCQVRSCRTLQVTLALLPIRWEPWRVLSRLDQTWVLTGAPWLLWGEQIFPARLVGAASFSLPIAQRNFLGPMWWPRVPARHSPRPVSLPGLIRDLLHHTWPSTICLAVIQSPSS